MNERMDGPRFPNLTVRILLPASLCVILFIALILWVTIRTESRGKDTVIRLARQAVEKSLEVRLARDTALLKGELEFLAPMFRDGAPTAATIAQNKATLAAKLRDLKATIGATQLYWIDRGHRTVFRAHDPDHDGDTIDRETLRRAERTRAVAAGLEFGNRGAFTLRVVHPVLKNGDIVAFLEINEELHPIVEDLARTLGMHLAVFIEKHRIDRTEWEKLVASTGGQNDWDRFNGHVTSAVPDPLWAHPRFLALLEESHPFDEFQFASIEFDGRSFATTAFPIRDVNGESVGEFWVARDLSPLSFGSDSLVSWPVVIGLAACIAILALIAASVRHAQARLGDAAQSLVERQIWLEEEVRAQTLEMRESEQAASQTSRLLRSIVDALPVWVVAKDQQGRTYMVNRVMADDTMVPEANWVGRTVEDLPYLNAEQKRIIAQEDAIVMRSGQRLENSHWRFRDRNGALRTYRTVRAPVFDAQGQVDGVLSIAEDITIQAMAEERLRESEARLRQVIRASRIGIFDHVLAQETLYWSPEQRAICGLGSDELVTQDFRDSMLHPDDRDRVAAAVRHAQDPRGDGLMDSTHRIIRNDGAVRWVEARSETFFEGEGAARKAVRTIGTTQDVTARKDIELALRDVNAALELRVAERTQALAESESRYRIVVENSLQGVMVVQDGRITFANKAEAAIFGFEDPAQMHGIPFENLVAVRHLAFVAERTRSQQGTVSLPDAYEFTGTARDGRELIVDTRTQHLRWQGRPATISAHLDITERRRVAEKLRKSESRYRSIVDTAYEGIWAIDLSGNTTFANARMAEMLGCSLDTLRKASALDFLNPKHRPAALAHFASYARGESSIVEVRLVREDGKTLDALSSCSPIRDESGQPIGALGMFTDITDRKAAETELRQTQETLIRSERLATVGQLTATVSHELRNPLGTIRASIYSLKDKLKDNSTPAVNRIVDRIDRNVDRCDNIVTDLLDFSRTRGLKPEPVDLGSWLKAELADMQLPDWLNLRFDLPDYPVQVRIDSNRFRRVLVNLVENSVQAMTECRAKLSSRDWCIAVRMRDDQGCITLALRDTGMGIPKSVLPRVFDPLFSTKTYGIGLGLLTVRQIVREHGGDIEVVSEEGTGTEARIAIPLGGVKSREIENQATQTWQ